MPSVYIHPWSPLGKDSACFGQVTHLPSYWNGNIAWTLQSSPLSGNKPVIIQKKPWACNSLQNCLHQAGRFHVMKWGKYGLEIKTRLRSELWVKKRKDEGTTSVLLPLALYQGRVHQTFYRDYINTITASFPDYPLSHTSLDHYLWTNRELVRVRSL